MRKYDQIIHYSIFILIIIGLVFIFSAYTIPRLVFVSVYEPQSAVGYLRAFSPFFKLIPSLFIGLAGYYALVNYEKIAEWAEKNKKLRRFLNKLTLKKFIFYFTWFTIFLMSIVVLEKFVFHLRVNRWLIGPLHMVLITGLTVLSYYLFLAYELAKEKPNIPKLGFVSICFLLLLLAQPDVGTTLLLAFSLFTLIFFRGKNKYYTYGYYLSAVFVMGIALFTILKAKANLTIPNFLAGTPFGHVIVRINNWLNPFNDITASSFQIANSLYAVHRGGLDGVGYGFGTRKLYMGATVHTDFIFATIGEETGFIFAVFIFAITLIILLRLLVIAYRFRDRFFQYFTILVAIETFAMAFMNAGMAVNLLPSKGWPYPLISYAPFYEMFYLIQLGIIQLFVKKRSIDVF
jgi:cell division protein FtsW